MPSWTLHNGAEIYHLRALEALGGVRAIFTGRRGVVSERWSGGLNWSQSVGDSFANVQENRTRSLAAIDVALDHTYIAGLIHGDRVVAVTGQEPLNDDQIRLVPDCDALITNQRALALVVTAADCVPILLYDPVGRAVAAIHAGWRGTVLGICGKTMAAMTATYGSLPGEIHAAIGPSIGPCCYEVDDVVAEPLRAFYGVDADGLLRPGSAPGKYLLDLWAANRLDLTRAGVKLVNVAGECTACGVDWLFSHRAEAGKAGRGAAIIALA
jgi:YfiH family protein